MNTVLIATERDLEQNLLAQALGTRGFDVVRSRDGLEALESARANPPQILVANVSMPRMDGFALFRRCKQDEQLRRIPFILYSPRSNDAKSERFALELGATRFVSNALKPDTLLHAIEEVLAADKSANEDKAKKNGEAPPVAQVISLEARQRRDQSTKLQQELQSSQAQLHTLQQQLQAVQLQAHAMQTQLADVHQAEQFVALFNSNPVAMWLVDKTSQAMLAVNEAALHLFGYNHAEFLELDNTTLLRSHAAAPTNTTVLAFQHRDGRSLSLILSSRDLEFQGHAAELIAAHDVSYRVRGERAIVDELQRVKTLLGAVPLPYWVIDGESKLLDASERYCQQSGYRREELLGRHITSFLADAAETPAATTDHDPQPARVVALKYKDGSTHSAELIVGASEIHNAPRVALIQIRAATAIAATPAANAHARLSTVLEMLRYADGADETTLLQYAVAQISAAFASPVSLFAAIDKPAAALNVLALSHALHKRTGNGAPSSIAVPPAWREAFLQRRIEPVKHAGDDVELNGIATLSNYMACPVLIARDAYVLLVANRTAAYSETEQQELTDCADIIAALLSLKRQQLVTQAAHQQARASTTAAIGLLTRVLDNHDPFAAGSNVRVASLALAIGRELGLAADRLEVLKLAAQLHDIGHLLLPQQLLLRPTELTAAECTLLETHSERGAQLLNGLELDPDVANIIAQHHERLDGSGYPRGLTSAAILLEARIIAVADVVEAMCATRAYRPAVGLAAALAELNKGSGHAYDELVVAACARIFTATNQKWPPDANS